MRSFIPALLLIGSLHASAQKTEYKGLPSLVWPKLYDIRFVKAKTAEDADKPEFGAAAKSLQGKIITLPGYLVPFTDGLTSDHAMLSSLPLTACFFCGAGGPETVVEVYLKSAIRYTEKPIEIQGRLKLNDKDPEKMIYILEQAVVTGEVEF
jgi:hypothetical protein